MSDPVTSPAATPNAITLRDIVTVIIRLLAINFAFYAFHLVFVTILRPHVDPVHHNRITIVDVLFPVVYLLIIYWIWALAGWVGRCVTKGHDAALSATQLTLLDLYSFGFLLIGLYVAIENIGPTLTSLHYALLKSSGEGRLNEQQQSYFYTLFSYLVKLIVGLGLIFNGRRLAARFIKRYPAATEPAAPEHRFVSTPGSTS
jgi:hypothetical protein